MKKFLLAAAVVFSAATVASAAPLTMTDQQLDQTAAGYNRSTVIITNTASTNVGNIGNNNGNNNTTSNNGNDNGNFNGNIFITNQVRVSQGR